MVFVAAVGGLALRTALFPKWVAAVGLLAGLGFLIGTVGVASDAAFFMIVGGFVGFLIWCVWLVAVSWSLWNTAEA